MTSAPRPLALQHFQLLIGTAPEPDDRDIDDFDVIDPYPNPEELLLAVELFLGRGYWSIKKPRRRARRLFVTKKWRAHK